MSERFGRMIDITTALNTGRLARLYDQNFRLQELQQTMRERLPNELMACNLFVVSYHRKELALVTNTAHWATRIRFALPELKQKLRDHFLFTGLQKITLRVSYKTSHPSQPTTEVKRASDMQIAKPLTSSSALQTLADRTKNQRLKKAIHQLLAQTQNDKATP